MLPSQLSSVPRCGWVPPFPGERGPWMPSGPAQVKMTLSVEDPRFCRFSRRPARNRPHGMRFKTSVLSAGFRLLVTYACYRPRLQIRYRQTEPAIPFPPPLGKAQLSAFSASDPCGHSGKKNAALGFTSTVRGPVVRTALSAFNGPFRCASLFPGLPGCRDCSHAATKIKVDTEHPARMPGPLP